MSSIVPQVISSCSHQYKPSFSFCRRPWSTIVISLGNTTCTMLGNVLNLNLYFIQKTVPRSISTNGVSCNTLFLFMHASHSTSHTFPINSTAHFFPNFLIYILSKKIPAPLSIHVTYNYLKINLHQMAFCVCNTLTAP